MENNDILDRPTGTREPQALKPAVVRIAGIKVEEKGIKKNKIFVCMVKHPDKEELIDISGVKYEKNGRLETSGLWINLDEDGNLSKGSPLALFKDYLRANTLRDLEGMDVMTIEDDKGYLIFKGY